MLSWVEPGYRDVSQQPVFRYSTHVCHLVTQCAVSFSWIAQLCISLCLDIIANEGNFNDLRGLNKGLNKGLRSCLHPFLCRDIWRSQGWTFLGRKIIYKISLRLWISQVIGMCSDSSVPPPRNEHFPLATGGIIGREWVNECHRAVAMDDIQPQHHF